MARAGAGGGGEGRRLGVRGAALAAEGGGGGGDGVGEVLEEELAEEARSSYLSYAMSVIVGRALPDARDGLKPVHRRILYAMHQLGLSPSKPHRKSARVVGEVLGKFHPHGDQSVYDALVRMAQSFSMRTPLVDGHGNFGSMDGDRAAAMRYTECRLFPAAADMLMADLEQDTVAYTPNFDESTEEPTVLPARLPNLLINGSQGIAVGMATNIPPHNAREVAAALTALIDDPDAPLEELMRHLPAPDFPTGGQIVSDGGLKQMYASGLGRFVLRGVASIEKAARGREAIIISELPYSTNKAALAERIVELADAKKLEGVADVRDESDREGMRLVVEVKRSADAQRVLAQLYRLTSLQSQFSANMVAIDGGEPKLMGLKEMLRAYLDFRVDVVQRRTRHLLREAERKLHRVRGFVLASQNAEAIVRMLKKSASVEETYAALEGMGMDRKQAESVLDMPVRRLSGLEQPKLQAQEAELSGQAESLHAILADDARVLDIIKEEAEASVESMGESRLTALLSSAQVAEPDEEEPEDAECIVSLTEMGYLKRMSTSVFARQNRGSRGSRLQRGSSSRAGSDDLVGLEQCNTADTLLLFTDTGKAYRLPVSAVPEVSRAAAGMRVTSLLSMPTDVRVLKMLPVADFGGERTLLMVTHNGQVLRTALEQFQKVSRAGLNCMKIKEGDRLNFVSEATPGSRVAISTRHGQVIIMSADDTRVSSRTCLGVRAITLCDDDQVVACTVIDEEKARAVDCDSEASEYRGPCLLVVSTDGLAKRVALNVFREQARGGKGVRLLSLKKGNELAAIELTPDADTMEREGWCIIVSTHEGIVNRIPLTSIRCSSRLAQGCRLIKLSDTDHVCSVTLAPGDEVASDSEDASSQAAAK